MRVGIWVFCLVFQTHWHECGTNLQFFHIHLSPITCYRLQKDQWQRLQIVHSPPFPRTSPSSLRTSWHLPRTLAAALKSAQAWRSSPCAAGPATSPAPVKRSRPPARWFKKKTHFLFWELKSQVTSLASLPGQYGSGAYGQHQHRDKYPAKKRIHSYSKFIFAFTSPHQLGSISPYPKLPRTCLQAGLK